MPQIFRTKPVGDYVPALYQLSIRAPNQAFSELITYTFPLSPTSIRMERNALSSFSETQGPSSTLGVTRIVDHYGLSPPIYTIEGTTGWDRHATDGYVLTGLQSMQLLDKFLQRYAELNSVQVQSGVSQMYALEFYDYFTQNFWQVEPVGPQGFRQTADRTKLVFYRFRWAAIQPVGIPIIGETDALLTVLGKPAAAAAINAAETIGAMLNSYSPVGLIPSLP
jgi:hypothetical protein